MASKATEKPLLFTSEDIELNENRHIVQSKHEAVYTPPDWLANAESPLKWLTSLEVHLVYNVWLGDKMSDYKNQGPDYGFEKYALLLSLAANQIRLSHKNLDNESGSDDSSTSETESIGSKGDDELVDPEKIYIKCREALEQMAARESDVMYTRIGPAMEHVLNTFRAHMFYLKNNFEESKEMSLKIQPLADLTLENQAGIEGIKAKFLLHVYKDLRVALETIKKAMVLDPKFAMWPYLAGKITRNIRRKFKEDMSNEELTYFKEAVELERDPKYLVFLAQAYQEMAFQCMTKKVEPECGGTIEDMLLQSVNLFRETWSLKNDSASISRRVGNGMMKMRNEFMDLSLAKKALLKAIELSPNTATYHQLGKLYYDHEKNDELALENFKTAGGFFGFGDFIRANLIKYPDYDPYDHVIEWSGRDHLLAKDEFICDLGFCYLFFKKDIDMSVKCFWEVLRNDYKCPLVMEFESYAFCTPHSLNIVEILVNEILLLKKKNHILPIEKRLNITFLENFTEKMLEKHPNLHQLKDKPDPNHLEKVFIKVKKNIIYLRNRRYGYCSNYKMGTVENRQKTDDSVFSGKGKTVWNSEFRKRDMNHEESKNWRDGLRNGIDSDLKNRNGTNSRELYGETTNKYNLNRRGGENSYNMMNARKKSYNQGEVRSSNNRYDTTISNWRKESRPE